ncbi:hypothetical protein [Nocardioides sp. AX2bis]|uniref:hypothetical protein n=1 Tax=Nocardioides sp. AX2bis TaxID=2653157 RepID=UPI0012F10E9F|nr:hypothetical protein [Nocardioides sp. AX2bis]VXC24866.1 hypothetical protein NOCARDAX2BIS_490029 [Nocardioides sp. AX2bis]
MRNRPQQADAPSPPSTSLPVVLVALVVVGVVAVLGAERTLDRIRADTAVQAVGQGEPGCVNAATFTGPDGVERRVDVTVYKANCLDRDPGDPVTVYYDAGDPSVTAPSRAWWWTLLPTLVATGAAAFLVRTAVRHVRGVRRDRSA